MRRSQAFVLALIVGLGWVHTAEACSCVGAGPACQTVWAADAVFVGTVVSIERHPLEKAEREDALSLRVTMTVTRAYRGLTGARVDIFTGEGGGDCGYPFLIGHDYLVFAHRTPPTTALATGICSTTRPLAEAAADLAYLNGLESRGPGTVVFGKIEHFEEQPGQDGLWRGPAVGFRVTLDGNAGTFETLTDERGDFRFDGVPVGRYRATVVAHPPYAPLLEPFDVQLPDQRACAEIGFGVRYDGRIDGRLVGPAGESIAGVTMHLRWAEPDNDDGTLGGDRETDINGRFSLGPLSPGRYMLAIGLERFTSTDIPFPTTWYPGGASRDEAAEIDVGPGDHIALGDFKIATRLHEIVVRGRVNWPPSVRLDHVGVYVTDADTSSQVREGKTVNADGSFEFTLNEGRRYVIEAYGTLPGTRFELRTQSDVIEPSAAMPEVTLLLTP